MPGLYGITGNTTVSVYNTTGLYNVGNGNVIVGNVNSANTMGLYQAFGNPVILNSAQTLYTLLSESGNVNFALTNGNTQVLAYFTGATSTYSNTNVAAFLPTYLPSYSGNVNATYFTGNGYYLTGIVSSGGTNYSNANVAAYLPIYSGNVSAAYVLTNNIYYANGTPYVFGSTYSNANVTAYLPTDPTIQAIQANTVAANVAIVSVQNNLASYETYANAQIATTNANLASYETYANAQIASTNANLTAFETYANIHFGDSNYGNANVAAYLAAGIDPTILGIDANVTAANAAIISVQANLTSFEIASNANVGAIYTHLGTLDANVGAYEIATTANIGTLYLGNISTQANLGAFQIYSNANVGSIYTHLGTLDANVGAYETWANSHFGTSNYGNANVAAYLATGTDPTVLGIDANVAAANTAIALVQTNLTSFEIASNANVGAIYTHLGTLDANVGAFEIYANANAASQAVAINSLNANVGAFEIYANANAASQAVAINSLNANVGAYEVYANTQIATITANLGTLYLGNISTQANLGAFETYANTQIATINANTTAANSAIVTVQTNLTNFEYYANSNFIGGNIISTAPVTIQSNIATGPGLVYINAYSGQSNNPGIIVLTAHNIELDAYNGVEILGGAFEVYAQTAIYGNTTLGNVTAATGITANYFYGNGSQLTGIVSSYGNVQASALIDSGTIPASFTTLNTTGQNIFGGNLSIQGPGTIGSSAIALYVSSGDAKIVGTTQTGNLITGNGVFWSNGVSYLADLYANAATQQTAINTITANLGAFETYANANIGTLYLGNISTQANLGAYQTYANAQIATVNANLGAFETYANATFTYGNANVAAYLPTYSGNINATVTNTYQPYVTQVGTLQQLVVAGNVYYTNTYVVTFTTNSSWTAPANLIAAAATIVAGGGSGGQAGGGGGGAGQALVNANVYAGISSGSVYSFTVGTGGNAAVDTGAFGWPGGNGGNTIAFGYTLIGGGTGGGWKQAGGTVDYGAVGGNGGGGEAVFSEPGGAGIAGSGGGYTGGAGNGTYGGGGAGAAANGLSGGGTSAAGILDPITGQYVSQGGFGSSTTTFGANSWQFTVAGTGGTGGTNSTNYQLGQSGIVALKYTTVTPSQYIGGITTTGNISTSAYFVGNGYYLTGLVSYSNANVASYLASGTNSTINAINANITAANTAIASVNANLGAFETYANATFVTSSGSYGNANVAAYLLTNTGNIQANLFKATDGLFLTTSNIGAFSYGTLNYADVDIFASYSTSQNNYAQLVMQNTNAGGSASVDLIVSNDRGNATAYYGDFGINSSGFNTGTGSLGLPNATYVYGQNSDLVLGTTTANAIHFVTNTGATDAITIYANNVSALANIITTNGIYWSNGAAYSTGGGGGTGTSIVNGTSNVSILTANANITMFANTGIIDARLTTGSFVLPTGGNSLRPTANAAGSIRFNTCRGNPEWYSAADGTWKLFSQTYTPSLPTYNISYLVVAGGGGAGWQQNGSGGGGAGGLLTGCGTLTQGTTYTTTVGAGGAGGTTNTGYNGSNSTVTGSGFPSITAIGGGHGGSAQCHPAYCGATGGSGGGGSDKEGNPASYLGGAGTPGQGYNGGNGGATPLTPYNIGGGGGGGGAGAVGVTWTTTQVGNGGVGLQSSITGSAVYYAGGGGGGTDNRVYSPGGFPATGAGTGGSGGGGNGAGFVVGSSPATFRTSTAGTTNTGGGGGGGNYANPGYNAGQAGGSGVVILSIPSANYSGNSSVTGPYTYGVNGPKIVITWTGSGTYTA